MAWLETDRHGRLRIGFKYYDGLKCREPLGVSANKQTIAEARRLCATIQLELKARTFDYAKRFPDSDRIKQRGIETPEKIQPISVTELADSWLLSKQGEVKKSTHGYYKEVAGIFIQRDAIGTKTVSELRQEDIDRWRVRVDEKQTKANEPLSTRRKNMAWDVLNQILEFARVRKLLNEDLLLGMKPFKDSGQANDDDSELSDEPEDAEVMPYNADQIEAIIAAAEGWERALVTLYFFTGIRRGEALALTWDRVYLDRDRALINRSLSVRYGITTPKTKSSRRMIQYGPRVRAELSKQRERVQLRSKYVFPNESGAAPNVRWATDVVWRRILDASGSSAQTNRAVPSQLRGLGAEAAQAAQLDSAADGSSHAANVVETLLALDTDRRSFCRRNVFAGERGGAVGLKSCPPYAHPARNRHRSGLVKQ